MTIDAADRVEPGSPHHHGSHRDLLSRAPDAGAATLDAIIVPTARNAVVLRPAMALAERLGCVLVVLSSKYSNIDAVKGLAEPLRFPLVAVDTEKLPAGLMPRFNTCEFFATRKRYERRTDTSLKRNFGLIMARLAGWQRVVFLDDDITVPQPEDLRRAAALTDRFAGVGLKLEGYPDNSVVCHAYRLAGGAQDVFIGGGALAVGARSVNSFFPNVYNEDWFFLLGRNRIQPVTTIGTARQKPYDPFANERRAKLEEFGDCLAEGLFWLLDNEMSLTSATVTHWENFLGRRARFIAEVADMVRELDCDPGEKLRMLASLKAARGRCLTIWPQTCVDYVAAWHADRTLWRAHVRDLHRTCVPQTKSGGRAALGIDKVIPALGVEHAARQLRVT